MKKILTLLFIGIFLISCVSALEWDNVKSYDEDTKVVTITNALGLGADLAKIELMGYQRQCIPGSCYLTYQITVLETNLESLKGSVYYTEDSKIELLDRERVYEIWDADYSYVEEIYGDVDIGDNKTAYKKIGEEIKYRHYK